ncbi:MAG: ATP-binding protein [Acidobacteria bacterium]|nr:ATP-binding protein [Acidobacteriota bacterium]
MITRVLKNTLAKRVDHKKAIILLGPRQVGKTTLITEIAASLGDHLFIDGDDPETRLQWSNPSKAFVERYVGKHKVVVIDEAQRLENIGVSAKMIIDAKKGVQLFISGSSALELANKMNEPLTGRKWEYLLYPLSWKEIQDHYSFAKTLPRLEEFLITGMYPEVVTHADDAVEILKNLAGSYLYKDILELAGVRRPELLLKILRALAWQVGSEVSYNELAQSVGADKNTVSSYIDLLEKSFVVFKLNPFARNLRREINTKRKIYFYDNGVRNCVIGNFSPLGQRNDVGALWENFIIGERKKYLAYNGFTGNTYFWRDHLGAEIDYVEEAAGKLTAFELKWNPKAKVRFPKAFLDAYQPSSTEAIHRENYWNWLDS